MHSLMDKALESNRRIKINFDGGDLSSDSGLLLVKEFSSKMGFDNVIDQQFQTNDTASFRHHTDDENLLQVIYQVQSAYFEDDCADELTNDPVFTAILGKPALASQPTLSRFYNRMDGDTLTQFDEIGRKFRSIVYSVKPPEMSCLIWTPLCLKPTANRKARHSTSTTAPTAITHSCALTV